MAAKVLSLTPWLLIFLISCTNPTPDVKISPVETSSADGKGEINLVANGEEFIRQGLLSKDGWQITFEQTYVTLNNITAYQTDPPYDPEQEQPLKAKETVTLLTAPKTIDIAAGDTNVPPIPVTQSVAPVGMYNALRWQVLKATTGAEKGSSILLKGQATKDNKTLSFTLKFDQEMNYVCGEYIGEEQQGLVKDSEPGQLEVTFHLDHVFGNGKLPANDEINQTSLGFEPIAQLAKDGQVELDRATLQATLAPPKYQQLEQAILSLGHVGEGHCKNEK